jgi:3-hydroxy-9,10-secoandrosta-1,3,5(10)-triene-9,17-dione monooxygenase reductase component
MTLPDDLREWDPRELRHVFGHHPTGVCVITAMDDGRPVGMVVGSFASVSLHPPLVAFLPDKSSSSFPGIRRAGSFVVNVLSSDQEQVSRTFAARGGDKFAELSWTPSEITGSPILEDVVAWVECHIDSVIEAGDHYIVLGRVLGLAVVRDTSPMVFFQGGYGSYTDLPSL